MAPPPHPVQIAPAMKITNPANTSPRRFRIDGIHSTNIVNASVAAAALPGINHRGLLGLLEGLNTALAAVVVQVSVKVVVGVACVNVAVVTGRKTPLKLHAGGEVCEGPDTPGTDNVTANGKPDVAVVVMPTVPDCPGADAENDEAVGVRVYMPTTTNDTPFVTTVEPLVPLTVTLNKVPAATVEVTVTESVVVCDAPNAIELGLIEHVGAVAATGLVAPTTHVNATVPVNPFVGATVNVTV